MSDLDEQPWFVFRLPEATAYVPASSEERARRQLVASSYKSAPVASWPCIGSRYASRQALVRALLRPRAPAHQGSATRAGEDGNG